MYGCFQKWQSQSYYIACIYRPIGEGGEKWDTESHLSLICVSEAYLLRFKTEIWLAYRRKDVLKNHGKSLITSSPLNLVNSYVRSEEENWDNGGRSVTQRLGNWDTIGAYRAYACNAKNNKW